MLTCYDATMARLLDRAGIDALLVGDSLGMVISGQANTLGVTMDVMVHHTKAVRAGTKRAVVIADMPFLSYHTGLSDAVRNAGRLIQEGGALAVKLEGGRPVSDTVKKLVEAGIPVMGHIGLTPQSVNTIGGFRRVGVTPQEHDRLLDDALAIQEAGAFAMVLECIPHDLAMQITASVAMPTIGIGAGPHCDGQVLVSYDALGIFDEFIPSFVKQYVKLGDLIERGTTEFIADIQSGKFRG
jgi:3-methyl-2-oxobutanoate hydroxymethyltransferase